LWPAAPSIGKSTGRGASTSIQAQSPPSVRSVAITAPSCDAARRSCRCAGAGAHILIEPVEEKGVQLMIAHHRNGASFADQPVDAVEDGGVIRIGGGFSASMKSPRKPDPRCLRDPGEGALKPCRIGVNIWDDGKIVQDRGRASVGCLDVTASMPKASAYQAIRPPFQSILDFHGGRIGLRNKVPRTRCKTPGSPWPVRRKILHRRKAGR